MRKAKPKLLPCSCCGAQVLHERGAYQICPRCGWEDDPVQSADPDFAGGANKFSLNDARVRWKKRRDND